MTSEQQREKVIQSIANQLRRNPFTVDFKVVKKPKGIHIIHEVTQEELDAIIEKAAEKENKEAQ